MITAVCGAGTPCGAERLQDPIASSWCAPATLTCEQLIALGYAYPYAREPGSYLFINGAAYPYVELSNDPLAHGSVQVGSTVVATMKLLQTLGLEDRIPRRRTPVIGYGSNAALSALTRKYVAPGVREPAVIPVTRALLRDYDVVWSPHLVFNGAMPSTIVRSRGTVVEVWITWLDDLELERMHESEGAGTLYSYGTLSASRLVSEVALSAPPHVYVDCYGRSPSMASCTLSAVFPRSAAAFPRSTPSRPCAVSRRTSAGRAASSRCCSTTCGLLLSVLCAPRRSPRWVDSSMTRTTKPSARVARRRARSPRL